MLNNRNNSTCPREDRIISYLYRELTPVEVEQFEAHLATCSCCVDELAALSEPHLAVYEWRTHVFEKFPTPSIELQLIPEHRPHSEGLLDSLTALLADWPVGLRVGVVFAAVLVVGLSAYLFIRPLTGTEVAQNQTVYRADDRVSTEEHTLTPEVEAAPSTANVTTSDPAETFTKTARAKHSTVTPRKTAVGRAGRTEFASNSKERSTTRHSLRLNNFEDDDDTTLRLADLFEEVGSL